jgi:hypothetical protein
MKLIDLILDPPLWLLLIGCVLSLLSGLYRWWHNHRDWIILPPVAYLTLIYFGATFKLMGLDQLAIRSVYARLGLLFLLLILTADNIFLGRMWKFFKNLGSKQ